MPRLRPAAPPKSITIRLTDSERAWLEKRAREECRKPSAYLRWLLYRDQEEAKGTAA